VSGEDVRLLNAGRVAGGDFEEEVGGLGDEPASFSREGNRDGADLARLAARHPKAVFILAHIGGGGDYAHTFHAVKDSPNICPDLSGSGVDRGMLDDAIIHLGAQRLLWGSDVTMETGLAKLRALEATGLLTADALLDIRWRNAARIFGPQAFAAT